MGLFYIQLLSVHTIRAQINSILQHQSSMPGHEKARAISTHSSIKESLHAQGRNSWTNTRAMDCLPAMELARESSVGWRNTDSWYSEQLPHLKNYVSSSIYSDLRIKLNSCSLLDPWLPNQKQQEERFEVLYEAATSFKGGVLSWSR